jgi:transposase-like protein
MRLPRREIKEVSSMRLRRSFDRQFKREITEAILSGKISQLEVSRKYSISPVVISRWKKEYYSGKFFENTNPDYARLSIKVKELERMVGRLTMENDALKEMVKLVEPQNKASQQIFTSQDWEALKKDMAK